ncbi:hypothetical protein BJ878DRAFT_506445 [Calycina marina]|uniref:Uncharacterized protein n=1 Tax=Calycina marina TaxID=1763456 RepID=A0A9P7Z2Z0_9HELO|nr:hypothetical protein BJ878DRAFT_506445 [Calycina marina]
MRKLRASWLICQLSALPCTITFLWRLPNIKTIKTFPQFPQHQSISQSSGESYCIAYPPDRQSSLLFNHRLGSTLFLKWDMMTSKCMLEMRIRHIELSLFLVLGQP